MIFNYGTIQEETNQILYNINMKMNLEKLSNLHLKIRRSK